MLTWITLEAYSKQIQLNFHFFAEEVDSNPAVITTKSSTTSTAAPPPQAQVSQSCTPESGNNSNPLPGPTECAPESTPGAQEVGQSEPTNGEQRRKEI